MTTTSRKLISCLAALFFLAACGDKETPPAPGHDRVLYAGQLEAETEQERRQNGIPLHREVIQWFNQITHELQIPNPL